MKRSRWFGLGAVLLAISMLVMGCRKVSVESLFRDAGKEMGKMKAIDMDVVMDIECEVKNDGNSILGGLSVHGNLKEEINKGGYFEGGSTINLLGSDITAPIMAYRVKEGDSTLTYLYRTNGDYWTCEKTESRDLSEELTDIDGSQIMDKLKLETNTTDYNGRKCYKVTGKIEPAADEKLMESFEKVLEEGNIDSDLAKYLKANVEIYFDKDSGSLAGVKIDLSDSDWDKLRDDASFDEDTVIFSGKDGKKAPAIVLEIKLNDAGDYKFRLPEEIEKNSVKTEDGNIVPDNPDGNNEIQL